jgi:hypothetical protein
MIWPHADQSEEVSHLGKVTAMNKRPRSSINRENDESEQRTRSACEQLRTSLPRYDTVLSTLVSNGAWWSSYRQKIQAADSPIDSLSTFASRAYTSNDPTELGVLAIAYARSSNENCHLYALVENMIISDSEHAFTPKGLECLILLAKTYTDFGQPRKAWLVWRRGVAIAQMMVRTIL